MQKIKYKDPSDIGNLEKSVSTNLLDSSEQEDSGMSSQKLNANASSRQTDDSETTTWVDT